MRQIIDLSTRNGKDRHSLDGAVVLDLAHQPSGKDLNVWPDEEHLTLYVRLRDQRCVRMSFRQVSQCKQLAETHDLVGAEFKLNTDDADGPTGYFVTGRDGRPLLRFLSGLWVWREFDQDDIFAFQLDARKQAMIREMMAGVVSRDPSAVIDILPAHLTNSPDDFWRWTNDYGIEGRLNLIMPPGDVRDWDMSGFHPRSPNGGKSDDILLHAEVWADFGRTDLTLQFVLYPDGNDWRIELEQLLVM